MILTQQDAWIIAGMVLGPGIITGCIVLLIGICKISERACRWLAKESKQ